VLSLPLASTASDIGFGVVTGAVLVFLITRYAAGPVDQRRIVLAAGGLFVVLALAALVGS
jgi:hypothetical protein